MDTARYVVAVLLVTFVPPGLAWWFIVHPFVDFWRRVGVKPTLSVVGVVGVAGVAALMPFRDRLLMDDFGTRPVLVAMALVLMAGATWLAVLRKRHLTMRILAGVPELANEDGALLEEGVYAMVRHPRYVEVAIGVWAYAVFSNYLGAYIVAAVTMPVLHLIVLMEEKELRARFGTRYVDYMERVPRYVPRVRPERPPRPS